MSEKYCTNKRRLENEKVLWISASVPYDSVERAGGKIHNYYLKYLKKEGQCDIKLVSFYWKREEKSIDLQKYGIY